MQGLGALVAIARGLSGGVVVVERGAVCAWSPSSRGGPVRAWWSAHSRGSGARGGRRVVALWRRGRGGAEALSLRRRRRAVVLGVSGRCRVGQGACIVGAVDLYPRHRTVRMWQSSRRGAVCALVESVRCSFRQQALL